MATRLEILDTTLRDGNKLPFMVLNVKDRLEIARQLARLGVDIIDAGYPAASPEDLESVRLIGAEVQGPLVSALSRPLEEEIVRVQEALANCPRPHLHLFLPISPFFLETVLKKGRKEVLAMIETSVRAARGGKMTVQFSLTEIGEAEENFLLEGARAAAGAGASVINLADTNGMLQAAQAAALTAKVRSALSGFPKVSVGVHFHNDLGLATANTLSALEAGATHLEATVGGIGCRAGNTPLEEVLFNLEAQGERCGFSHGIRLGELHRTSAVVSYITGIKPHPNKPILGKSAFQEARGSHSRQSMSEKLQGLMSPSSIGDKGEALFGDQSTSFEGFTQELEFLGIETREINLEKAFQLYNSQIRRKGGVTRSEILAMVEDARLEEKTPYLLASFSVMTGSKSTPVGCVELRREDKTIVQSAHGLGPVDALCRAVDRATGMTPQLVLYSVDALTEGKDARAQVTVTLNYLGSHFHGHGISTDVVEASVRAYLDAVNRIENTQKRGSVPGFYVQGEYLWE